MALALKALKQKHGVNFQTLVVSAVLSAAYVNGVGESANLSGASIPNPGGLAVTGPNNAPLVPPRVTASIGGYTVTLTPTATPLVYTLQVYAGVVELASANYPAAILNGTITIEIDF